MRISVQQAAEKLQSMDDVLILMHKNPDGDACGSAMALYYAFKQMGKRSRIECHDKFPSAFSFLKDECFKKNAFEHKYIVAVDIASPSLLGDLEKYDGDIDLCIDHHVSNTFFAKNTCLDENAAAAAELIFDVLNEMNLNINADIANCLYTGIVTDTCCFRFASTTANTHIYAAKLIEAGAAFAQINNIIFTKTKQQLLAEHDILNTMEYYFGNSCAVVTITRDLMDKFIKQNHFMLDNLSGLARQIQGIDIGITIKEFQDECKISVRCSEKYNANEICSKFGGGGHRGAAGCTLATNAKMAKKAIIEFLEPLFSKEACL